MRLKITLGVVSLTGLVTYWANLDMYKLPDTAMVVVNGTSVSQLYLFGSLYFIWELSVISMLFAIWYKHEKNKYLSMIALFCSSVWLLRALWKTLMLLGLVNRVGFEHVGKVAAVCCIFIVIGFAVLCILEKHLKKYI